LIAHGEDLAKRGKSLAEIEAAVGEYCEKLRPWYVKSMAEIAGEFALLASPPSVSVN
jgi:hypothetical protein